MKRIRIKSDFRRTAVFATPMEFAVDAQKLLAIRLEGALVDVEAFQLSEHDHLPNIRESAPLKI